MSHSLLRYLSLVFLVASVGLLAPARADEAAGSQRWTVIAECQMVTLPQKAALPLLPDLGDDAKIEAAFATLQEMIGRGEATLVANLVVRGASDAKLASESVEELRYATEFDPPELPGTIPTDKPLEFLKAWPAVAITPTAFETRKLGALLDFEGRVSEDGQWVTVDAAPQHVRFLKYSKYDAGVLAAGGHLTVDQPQFSVVKNTFTLEVRAGQRLLVGIHKVPTEENTMELFFLRVRTQKAGPAK